MPSDLHIHGLAHDGPPHNIERLLPYVEHARSAGLTEIGFAEHDRYQEYLDFNVFEKISKISGLSVRAGLEVDCRPGIDHKSILSGYPWDYIIGSVHSIGSWEFDRPGEEGGFDAWDMDELYKIYFELVEGVASTGLYQIIGHMDLIKIYGHRPRRRVTEIAGRLLQVVAGSGAALEVNTAGLFKPVAEIYPGEDLLKEAYNLNIPVTVTSDAHAPGEVGRERARALQMLRNIGYASVVTFHRMKKIKENL